MKILARQHIGKDVSTVSEYMKGMEKKSYINGIGFLNSDVYSLEFEFIPENEKDKKDYWLKIWRLQKHISEFINFCITDVSNDETDERIDIVAELLKQGFVPLGENTINGFNKVGEKLDILREDTNKNFQKMDEKYGKLSDAIFATVEKIEKRNK